MGSTIEDKPLIKRLRVSKGYRAASLCKMFLDNTQTIEYWWNEMFKYKNWHDQQFQAVRLIADKLSSMQWHSVHTPANISKVEDLALSQKINHENRSQ